MRKSSLYTALGAVAAIGFTAIGLAACHEQPAPSSNAQIASEQDIAMQQLERSDPVPFPTYSFQRHITISMFVAEQMQVRTYSVVYDQFAAPGSRIEFACPSLGYPVPGGTQLTNPQMIDRRVFQGAPSYSGPGGWYTESGVIDQAEPNGLFPPSTADATMVPCVNSAGKIVPTYVEHNVEAFAYPVHEDAHGRLVPDDGAQASVTIDPQSNGNGNSSVHLTAPPATH